MIAGRLKHHVFKPSRGLYRGEQHVSVLHRPENGRDSRGHMLSMFQCFDAMTRMAGCIGRHIDGFDLVVLHHLFKRRIGFVAPAGFGEPSTTFRHQIGHCHNFHVGMVLKSEIGPKFAHPVTSDPDSKLAIRERLPVLVQILGDGCALKALDGRLGRSSGTQQSGSTGAEPESLDKRTA
ncbi:hypothetical protein SDC9_183674 [bioreactor metagenome]|uniref:Uncharacterized protein n=1 Tax=bioreactor metagenome TaxID=1076179 RepID=A0A645HAW3_9ZZZZ